MTLDTANARPLPPPDSLSLKDRMSSLSPLPSSLLPGQEGRIAYGTLGNAVRERAQILQKARGEGKLTDDPDTSTGVARTMLELMGIFTHERVDGLPKPTEGKKDIAEIGYELLSSRYSSELETIIDRSSAVRPEHKLKYPRSLTKEGELTPEERGDLIGMVTTFLTTSQEVTRLTKESTPLVLNSVEGLPPELRGNYATSLLHMIALAGSPHYAEIAH